MLPRTLEPEVMGTEQEALDYDAMDHSGVNLAFVDDFRSSLQCAAAWLMQESESPTDAPAKQDLARSSPAAPNSLSTLDVGTGTAQIPIRLCRSGFAGPVTGIDLSAEMINYGTLNVIAADLQGQIRFELIDAKRLPYADGSYDAVISNSIVHHIPEPNQVLAEMLRVLAPGGLLFIRDLMRPHDAETVDRLVQTYAGEENAHQRQMFHDSLHAALTLEEIQQLLSELDIPADWARATSDRHWTISGRKPISRSDT
jgi:ubiquinone/menaquinone biosynthesis C-methylase UbiE